MPTKSPQTGEVAAALRRVLRRGLPVTPAVVDPVLLALQPGRKGSGLAPMVTPDRTPDAARAG